MNKHFKPSSNHLFEVLKIDPADGFPPDETYSLYKAAIRLTENQHNETVVNALMASLEDQFGNYAGEQIAKALVNYGYRNTKITNALPPYDAMLFRWRDDSLTAEKIVQMLNIINMIENLDENSIQEINTLITNQTPINQGDNDFHLIMYELFADRLQYCELRCDDFRPTYDDLLQMFAVSARPQIEINNIKQFEVENDDAWVIQYEYEGEKCSFRVNQENSCRLYIKPIMESFNNLMHRTGSNNCVFILEPNLCESHEFGTFIVADKTDFQNLARQLHIPISTT